MDPEKNRATLSLTSPGQPNFVPWAVDTTFGPGYTCSPKARADDPVGDYFPGGENQPAWVALDAYPQAPLSAAPATTPVSYFTGEGLMGPGAWTLETDSDSCDVSPVDGRYPRRELDVAPATRWSWSQPSSSPPFEAESLLPPLQVVSSPKRKSSAADPPPSPTSPKATKAKLTPRLRTASRRTRRSAADRRTAPSPSELESVRSEDAVATPDEARARRNHNLVEKQYRNRLNAQFERLLFVLPSDQQRRPGHGGGGGGSGSSDAPNGGGGGGDDEGSGGDDKRMSKAEVLDVARRRIKELEMERRRLQRERKDLLQSIEMMSSAVSRSSVQR